MKTFFSADFAACKSSEFASSCSSLGLWDLGCFWFAKPGFFLLHVPISAVSRPPVPLAGGCRCYHGCALPRATCALGRKRSWLVGLCEPVCKCRRWVLLPGPNRMPHLCGAGTHGKVRCQSFPPPSMSALPQQHLMHTPCRSASPLLCTCFTGKCLFCFILQREGKRKGKAEEGGVKLSVLWDVASVLPRSVSGSPLCCKYPHFSQIYKMTLVAPSFSQACALRAC